MREEFERNGEGIDEGNSEGGWKEHGRTDRNLKNNCQVNEGIMKIIKYA